MMREDQGMSIFLKIIILCYVSFFLDYAYNDVEGLKINVLGKW